MVVEDEIIDEEGARERTPLRAELRDLADGSRELVVPPFARGDRLDGFLSRYGGDEIASRAEWQRLIDAEKVFLNGRAGKSGERVSPGDRIRVFFPPRKEPLPEPEDVPFEVLYQDPEMIVINKPAGVVVHPAPGNETGTLVNGLVARFPELRDVTGDLRPGIVHRLDKDTSGLMVIGRTPAATVDLQRQMHDRKTTKRYLLLTTGNVEEEEGMIDKPITRDPRNRQKMAVREGGRTSRTRFWVTERFGDYTLVEALLLTGRTHQLRVHFASIGRPIAGDTLYGTRRGGPSGLKRQFLHAFFLKVRSPHDGLEREFEIPLAPDLQETLDTLRKRGPRSS